MHFLRRFRTLAYLLVVLSIVAFTYAESDPPLMIFALAAVGASWWLVEMPGRRPLPRWLINFGVLLASFLLFSELVIFQQQNLLLGLGHFMTGILICKMFEMKTNRDYGQILTLSLLIMVSATIMNTDLLFGLLLIVYLILGLYAILVFHLRCETDRAMQRHAATDHSMLMPSEMATVARDMRRITMVAGVVLVLFSSAVFLVFPRGAGANMLGPWRDNPIHQQMGLTDRVHFGSIGRLQQNDTVVMEVRIERGGRNIGSEVDQPYFRGLTLDEYRPEKQAWERSPNLLTTARDIELWPAGKATLYPNRAFSRANMLTQRYSLTVGGNNLLFSVAPAVTVRSKHISNVTVSYRDQTLMTRERSNGEQIEYEVDSLDAPDAAIANTSIQQEFMWYFAVGNPTNRAVQAFAVAPRIEELAKTIAGDLLKQRNSRTPSPKLDEEIAQCFLDYLQKNYRYSLDLAPIDKKIDPTEDFLLNRKQKGGHCEYFASAMIMLCRSVGLNARMVTGYHGGDYNNVGGYYVVRQKHAHAWVEVNLPNRGWVMFDPTPSGDAAVAGSHGGPFKWVRDMFGVVERNWTTGIISFDDSTRKALLKKLSFGFESWGPWLQRQGMWILSVVRETFLSPELSTGQRGFRIGVGVVALLTLYVSVGRWFGLGRPRDWTLNLRRVDRRRRYKLARELAFFEQAMRLLQRRGVRRDLHQTPMEYVELVCNSTALPPEDARWLVQTFYELRFGQTELTPALTVQIDQALLRLREAVAIRPPAATAKPTAVPVAAKT